MKVRVLLVEDDVYSQRAMLMSLTDLGYDVVAVAATGAGAVEQAREHKPDVVLMDVCLDRALNGIDAAVEIHEKQDIPIVFLTGNTEVTTAQFSKLASTYGFLHKPVKERSLHAAIEVALYRHALHRAALQQSKIDVLVPCWNRRAIFELLQRMASSSVADLAVLMLDVDHFKRLNDTFGHASGDAALIALTEFLIATLRQTDGVGRFGGEEFLIVLPCCDIDEAKAVAGRIVEGARVLPIRHAYDSIAITVSVGCAAFRVGDTAEAVIARADERLYAAKASGRDRCE